MPAKTTAAPETHSLVIEGNLVRVTKTIVERQVRTSDLLAVSAPARGEHT